MLRRARNTLLYNIFLTGAQRFASNEWYLAQHVGFMSQQTFSNHPTFAVLSNKSAQPKPKFRNFL